jgi:PDZ domain
MRVACTSFLLSFLAASGAFSASAQPASPPNGGQPYQNGELIKFMVSFASQHAAKSEFETSAANQARVASFTGHMFVLQFPATRDLMGNVLKYDADTGTMTVSLLGNTSIMGYKVIDGALSAGEYTKFFLLKSKNRTRTYQGSNAFGATAQVTVRQREEMSVAITNVLDGYSVKPLQQSVPMPSTLAQQLESRAKWRLTVETAMMPGQKDFILDDGHVEPTISDPSEFDLTGKTIMATLLKAELFDPQTGIVYATFTPPTFVPPIQISSQLPATTIPRANRFGIYTSEPSAAGGGLVVAQVADLAPAAAAGIQKGDVLLSLGDTDLKYGIDLIKALETIPSGTRVIAHVRRGTELLGLPVQF